MERLIQGQFPGFLPGIAKGEVEIPLDEDAGFLQQQPPVPFLCPRWSVYNLTPNGELSGLEV